MHLTDADGFTGSEFRERRKCGKRQFADEEALQILRIRGEMSLTCVLPAKYTLSFVNAPRASVTPKPRCSRLPPECERARLQLAR